MDIATRNGLVESVLPWINQIVRDYCKKYRCMNLYRDILQECNLHALNVMGKYNGRYALTTYIYRCISRYAPKVHKRLTRNHCAQLFDGEGEDIPDTIPAFTSEDVRELKAAMRHLSPKQRRVINLRYFQGMTWQEIGEEVGLSHEGARFVAAGAEKVIRKIMEKK